MKQRLDTTYALFDLAVRPTVAEDPLNQGAGPAVGSASSTSALPATPGAVSRLQTNITSPYAMAKRLVPVMHLSPPSGDSPTGASSLSSRGAAGNWGALTSRSESRLHLIEQYASPSRSSNSTGGTDTLLAAVNSALSVADLWSYMDIHDRVVFDKGQNIWDPSRLHVSNLARQQQLGGKFGGRIIEAVLDKIQQLSALQQQQQQQQQGGDTGLNALQNASRKKLHFGSVAEIMADWVALLLQPTSFERYGLDLRGTLPEEITQQMWHYSDHWDDRRNLGHAIGDLIAADPEVICSLLLSLVTDMVKPTNWNINAACDLITAVSSGTRGSSSSSTVALCMRDAVDAVQAASLQLLTPVEAYTLNPSSSSSSSSETGSQKNTSRKAAKVEHLSGYNEHRQEILAMGLSWSCLVSVLQIFAATAYEPTAAWGAAATNLALAYARQPGSSNAAAAVPMMLQLLFAAGVRPSSNAFEAAVETYTQDILAEADCWAGLQLQPAAGGAAAAAAARQLACEISVLIPSPDHVVKVVPFTPQQLHDCTFMAAAAAGLHYESHPITQQLQIMTLLSWQGPAGKLLMQQQQQQQQQGQQDEEMVVAGLVASALYGTVVLSAMEPKIAAAAAMAAVEDPAAAAAAVVIPEVAELRTLEQRKAAAYLQWQQTAVAQLRSNVTTILQEAAAALVSQQQQKQQQQRSGTSDSAAAGLTLPMNTGTADVALVAAASNHSSSSSSTLGLRAVQLLAAAAVLSATQFETDQMKAAAAAAAAGVAPAALVAAAIAAAAGSQAYTAVPHTLASTCSCELCNIQRVINVANSSANPASSSSSSGSGGARSVSCLLYSAEVQQQLQHLAEADLSAAAASSSSSSSSSLVLRYLAVIPVLGVKPSQQFVDSVINNMLDNILPIQKKDRSSRPVIMFRSKVDPETVEVECGLRYFDLARQQAVDSWFSAAVGQMLGLASANAPMPAGDLLMELLQLLLTAALYSSSSSSTKMASSANEILISGDTTSSSSSSSRGRQWLQLFVWLYCSKQHRPDCFWDQAFVPEWLGTGVTSALATAHDSELILFVDQYLGACRRPRQTTAAAAAAVTAAADQSGPAPTVVIADEKQQQADFLTNSIFPPFCADSGVCKIWKAVQQQLQARLAAALQTLQQQQQQQQQQGLSGPDSCCCMAYGLVRALICSTSSKYCPVPRYHSLSNSYMEDVMKHLADMTQNSDTCARILSDLWSAVADLQQQGVLGQIRWGGAVQCYDLAVTALVSRLVQGLMPLPEAAAAVYALQRLQARPGDEEADPIPMYYERWWFADLRFSWLPQLLMVELYKETARSTAVWPMHSVIPAALGPALLALHLSGWPYHSGTLHAYRVYQFIEWQVLRSSSSSSSSKVPARHDLSSVAAKAALEQLIAAAAMNAHLCTTQQLAQIAYGLLLLGHDLAAPRKSAAAVAAAAAAGSGAGSSESMDDMPYPVLALKSSAVFAPHILSINQQLLQRMLQMILDIRAAAAVRTAAAAAAAVVPPASVATIPAGCIVHATVVLVCCGLWSASQAVGNLVQLTAGKLSSMTWRELAQAVHLLYMCSGLDSSAVATATADAAAVGDSPSDMAAEPRLPATSPTTATRPLDHGHLLSPTAAAAADAPCDMAVEPQLAAPSPPDNGGLTSPMRLDAEVLAHASFIERWPVGWVAQAIVNDEGNDEEVSVLANVLQRGQVHTGGTTSSNLGHTVDHSTVMLDFLVKQQVISWLEELKGVIAVSYDELPDAQQLAEVFEVILPALEARMA